MSAVSADADAGARAIIDTATKAQPGPWVLVLTCSVVAGAMGVEPLK
jgi:hypothetical protein